MKANELIIGQKYIWRRNSSVTHEVTYLGCDDSRKFTMYEFEYLKEGEKMHTLLSVHHVDSDIEKIELEQEVRNLVDEIERTHRYSMSRIYGAFNKVFGTNETPQSCASCLIRKKQDLSKWLENSEYIPPYLQHINKV